MGRVLWLVLTSMGLLVALVLPGDTDPLRERSPRPGKKWGPLAWSGTRRGVADNNYYPPSLFHRLKRDLATSE